MRKDEICEVDRKHPQGISGNRLQGIPTNMVQPEQKCASHTPASKFPGKRSFCSACEASKPIVMNKKPSRQILVISILCLEGITNAFCRHFVHIPELIRFKNLPRNITGQVKIPYPHCTIIIQFLFQLFLTVIHIRPRHIRIPANLR